MATQNFFALLGDDENDDPSLIIARAGAAAAPKDSKKHPQKHASAASAKLPTKPLPPAQAVRNTREASRGGRGGGRGGFSSGRGNFGNRDRGGEGDFSAPRENGGELRSSYDGGRRPGRGRGNSNADADESGRRAFDRRSGTGRGNEVKRDGAGRGNWGTELDQGPGEGQDRGAMSDVQKPDDESQDRKETEEDDKEMTLDEYEKVLEEKRKAMQASKGQARKVTLDKDFESMQLVDKKNDDEIFLKLGSDKGKKKEDKEERTRKAVSINEFLKPTDGEEFFNASGRRGRGRGRGGFPSGNRNAAEPPAAPHIQDPGQFPILGGK